MEKKKIKWGKPKLIVLARGKSGEGVLSVCKTGGEPRSPFNQRGDCWTRIGLWNCTRCMGTDSS